MKSLLAVAPAAAPLQASPIGLPKRLLDLALLLLASPVAGLATALLAWGVLLMDGRPVFFIQVRLGRWQRPFRIYKLRTMTQEPDPKARRPTRFGKWLRARGLDELPQLLNVLRGEMSLVGPRPLTADDCQRLLARHTFFCERFRVPPGLTGLAQIAKAEGLERTAELEAIYAVRASTRLDLWILARTFLINVVGKDRGRRPRFAD